MSEEDIITLLCSDDHPQLKLALTYIQNEFQEKLSERIVKRLISLCCHPNPNIREEAVLAAGFYRQLPESMPVFAAIVGRHDEDELVLNAAIHAIAEILSNRVELRDIGLCLLAQVALNEFMPTKIRMEAYGLAMWKSGKMSTAAYAGMDASTIAIDAPSMLALCAAYKAGRDR